MIFRSLDSNGDWTLGRGKQSYKKSSDAIALNVKTRLLSWVGDCFFDLPAGIDWWNRLGSKSQRELLELDLRRVILQSEGVTGLTDFDTILNGRNFSARYTIDTIYSQSFIDSLTLEV